MRHMDTPITTAIKRSVLDNSLVAGCAVEVIPGDESWKPEAAIGPEATCSMPGIDEIPATRLFLMADSPCFSCCIVDSRVPGGGEMVIDNLTEPAQISTLPRCSGTSGIHLNTEAFDWALTFSNNSWFCTSAL